MKQFRIPRPTTEIVVFIIGILLFVTLIIAVFGISFPPRALCDAGDCKEGREWIATLLTFVVIVGGLFQYIRAQYWKRAEWMAAETESFFADRKVMNALRMLDWHARILPLLDDSVAAGRTFNFHSSMLRTALYSKSTIPVEPVTRKMRRYLAHELVIRDCFDRLLDRLERFQIFTENGLVSSRELKPYLAYWIRLIGDDENNAYKSRALIHRLWVYIDEYEFKRVQILCAEFGYDIRPTGGDRMRDTMSSTEDEFRDPAGAPEILEDESG